jgi:hypothetical protein
LQDGVEQRRLGVEIGIADLPKSISTMSAARVTSSAPMVSA